MRFIVSEGQNDGSAVLRREAFTPKHFGAGKILARRPGG